MACTQDLFIKQGIKRPNASTHPVSAPGCRGARRPRPSGSPLSPRRRCRALAALVGALLGADVPHTTCIAERLGA